MKLTGLKAFVPVIYPNIARNESWWLAGGIAAANCVAAYQAKGAASYAASLVNLANPGTYDASEGAAPTWNTATGWTFPDGGEKYLTTGIAASLPATLIYRVANGIEVGDKLIMGARGDQNHRIQMSGKSGSSSNRLYYVGSNISTVAGVVLEGVLALSAGNAAFQGYLDGSPSGSLTSCGLAGGYYYIGGSGTGVGAPSYWYQGDVIAYAIYSIELTGTQVAALSAALAAL